MQFTHLLSAFDPIVAGIVLLEIGCGLYGLEFLPIMFKQFTLCVSECPCNGAMGEPGAECERVLTLLVDL